MISVDSWLCMQQISRSASPAVNFWLRTAMLQICMHLVTTSAGNQQKLSNAPNKFLLELTETGTNSDVLFGYLFCANIRVLLEA